MSDQISSFTLKDRFRQFYPVVVDVETAGLVPETDAILEVSMMTVKIDENGKLVPDEQYHANIRPFPNSLVKQANIDFLGIDPFDESRNLLTEYDALIPMFKAISKKVKEHKCKRAILVGHNGHFDLGFINAATARLNYKRSPFHPFSVFDTASLGLLVYGQSVLAKACIAASINFDTDKAHGADYDTKVECELFCKIFNKFTCFCGMPEPVNEVIDYSSPKKEATDDSSAT